MQQQERLRWRPLPRNVQEVNIDIVQRHLELRERIEPRLLHPPVERGAPILDQLAQIRDIRAVGPWRVRRLVGKTRPRQPRAQFRDGVVRYAQLE